jgi:hypothetical protein
MTTTTSLQNFLAHYTPTQTQPAAPALIEAYRDLLPDALLELWRTAGIGQYNDGLLSVIDPERYKDLLWGWLMREEEDPSRLPIAISAFGTIFYYRRLSEEGDEDVASIDPHTSSGDVLVWSLADFFNETLCAPDFIEDTLEAPLFREALAANGRLATDQMYCYLPALRLGGSKDAHSIDRGDAATHLSFLLDLALDE